MNLNVCNLPDQYKRRKRILEQKDMRIGTEKFRIDDEIGRKRLRSKNKLTDNIRDKNDF